MCTRLATTNSYREQCMSNMRNIDNIPTTTLTIITEHGHIQRSENKF
jgi:hypothetical protein